MNIIKQMIAMIRSWFKASGVERRKQKPHKKHVHLSRTDKANLYRLWSEGEEAPELARAYNISTSTVYRVVSEYERKELRMYRKAIKQKEAA